MVGAGLSKHEADVNILWSQYSVIHSAELVTIQMMSTAFRKELHQFDVERALVAWDGMIAKQQMALEVLAVPTMFVSSSTSDMEVCGGLLAFFSSRISRLRTNLHSSCIEAEKGHASAGRHRWWRYLVNFEERCLKLCSSPPFGNCQRRG